MMEGVLEEEGRIDVGMGQIHQVLMVGEKDHLGLF